MKIRIKQGVSWSRIEQGLMIVHPIKDQCLVLNSSGEVVWNALQLYDTIEKVIETVCKEYDNMQRHIIEDDIQSMIELLFSYDLIEGDKTV